MDGGWGWMVLVGAFLTYFIADGWSYSFGIFFPEMVTYFGESKGTTALVPTLLYGIPLVLSPIICAFVSTFGCRPVAIVGGIITFASFILASYATSISLLCVSIGILTSIGLSATYVPSIIAVTYYFDKRRGLATGLAVTGSGLGAFAFPPIIALLMEEYSWKGTFLIFGGICLNMSAAGALYRPLPLYTADKIQSNNHPKSEDIDMTLSEESSKSSTVAAKTSAKDKFKTELRLLIQSMLDKSLFQDKIFLYFCAANFILYLWISIPYVYLYDRAILLEIKEDRAAYLLSIIGIARTVGQVGIGLVGDVKYFSINLLFGIGVAVIGLGTLMVPLCFNYVSMCVYSATFGFFISVTYVFPVMCLVEVIGLNRATNAFGLLQLVQGIGTLLGTPIAGWLYDAFGNYDISFCICGALILLSGLAICLVPCFLRVSRMHTKTLILT